MKNLTIFIILLFSTVAIQCQYKIEQGPKASKPYDQWQFELSNKSKAPITIQVYRAYGETDEHKKILTDYEYTIEPKGKLRIANINNKRFDIVLLLSYLGNKKEKNLTIRFPAQRIEKRILVKFDGERVVPQIGKAAGVAGETESGIPLTNNIGEKEIIGNKPVDVTQIIDNIFK
ncbi:MAG: hypothetical protein ACOYT8_03390 [Candidatus Dependentiae bacterium]